MTPVLFFQLVMGIIPDAFQTFAEPLLLTPIPNGGTFTGAMPPLNNRLFVNHAFNQIFAYQRFGYGTAMMWVLYLVILIFTLLVFKSGSYWVYYEVDQGGEKKITKTASVSRRRRSGKIVIYALLIGLTLVFLFPFLWMVVTSIKFRTEHNEYPFHFFPRIPQWVNYIRAWTWINFPKYLFNSSVIADISVVTFTLSSALVGYGFARLRAPGRSFLFILFLSTMMVPYMVTIIPTYILFSRILTDNLLALGLLGIVGEPFSYLPLPPVLCGHPQRTRGGGHPRRV